MSINRLLIFFFRGLSYIFLPIGTLGIKCINASNYFMDKEIGKLNVEIDNLQKEIEKERRNI